MAILWKRKQKVGGAILIVQIYTSLTGWTNYHAVTRSRRQNKNQVGAGDVKLCLLFELKELFDDPSRECGIAGNGFFPKDIP